MKHKDGRLSPKDFYDSLIKNEVYYFCGVPDSLLSPFSLFLEANQKKRHIIAANEGNAIGQAIGYYVSSGKLPLVYMQNSGLGNAIDPLVSLADSSVFSIPMLLLISWRGQPGIKDEPQHIRQGQITTDLLSTMEIPYLILSRDTARATEQVNKATRQATKSKKPYAILVEQNTFSDFSYDVRDPKNYPLSREQAIKIVAENLGKNDVVVASIGKISREIFEHRQTRGHSHKKDLLIVGGMGHASSIALAVAKNRPKRKVFCLDGDGSVLMHMGSLTTIGMLRPANFYHIVFNNGLHDSVGGQPTTAFDIDLLKIAEACNYSHQISVFDPEAIKKTLRRVRQLKGPVMLEIRVRSGARPDLIRPTISPVKNKSDFMSFLDEEA